MNNIKRTLQALLIFFSFTFLSTGNAQPSQTPQEFVDQVSVRSVAIISSAELALEISSSQEIKGYARKIISEYEPILAGVKNLAKQKDIKVLNENELKETAKTLVFQERSQQSFDVAYANNQVPAIQQLILMFQEASNSGDYEVRTFAAGTLPKLRRHLLMAEQILAGTAETKTDIYQDRDNQLDSNNPGAENEENKRIPTTDRIYP